MSAEVKMFLKQLQDYYAKHDPTRQTLDEMISVAELSATIHHSITWLNKPLRKKYGESIEDFLAMRDLVITYGDDKLSVHTIEVKKVPGRKLGLGISIASNGYILIHGVNEAGLAFEQHPDLANVGRLITAVNGVATAGLSKAQTIDLLRQAGAVVKISLSDIPVGIEFEVQQGKLSNRGASVQQAGAATAGAISLGDEQVPKITRFRKGSALVKSRRQFSHVSLESADELYVRTPSAGPSRPNITPKRARPGSRQFRHLGSPSSPGQQAGPRQGIAPKASGEGRQVLTGSKELAIRGAAAVETSKGALFDLEVGRSTLKLKKIIGSGQFGDVWGTLAFMAVEGGTLVRQQHR